MRDIKFRCWQVEEFDDEDNPVKWQMIPADCLAFEKFEPLVDLLQSSEHEIFMQFTGLKDKNAKEIYEGDIVKIPLFGNTIIIWNESICAFQYAYHAVGKGTSIDGRMTNTLYDHETFKYEIIGNIYENPELVNQKQETN